MATVKKTNARKLPNPGFGGAAPYGNAIILPYDLETNASGVLEASDQATALIVADKVILGVLPRGMLITDILVRISDAFTASTTIDLGFEYVDGTDVTAVPQDADSFVDGGSTAALGVLRMSTTNKPVLLPKDAYLIATIGGATHASAGKADIFVIGLNKGVG